MSIYSHKKHGVKGMVKGARPELGKSANTSLQYSSQCLQKILIFMFHIRVKALIFQRGGSMFQLKLSCQDRGIQSPNQRFHHRMANIAVLITNAINGNDREEGQVEEVMDQLATQYTLH